MRFKIILSFIVFFLLNLISGLKAASAANINEQKIVIKDYKCYLNGQWVSGLIINRGNEKFIGKYLIKLIDTDSDVAWQNTNDILIEAENGKAFDIQLRNGNCLNKKVQISIINKKNISEGIWEDGKSIELSNSEYIKKDISSTDVPINYENSEDKGINSKLNLSEIKTRNVYRDAVAIIIGVQGYKRLAKADFADKDASKFAEYAHRALSIPKEKIRLLTESDADQAALLKTFRNWLPLNVNKGKTEVFVFYSGHGLPSNDGKSLYLLPHGVDQDLLDETAIDQKKIIAAIQSTQPKSVMMFIDSCYSGQSRNGTQLLVGAKPITLKNSDISYPLEFTVFTASAADQISSSSPELQHGIFSFYLMKGMEGNADMDRDGKITFGEMQKYLLENVQRQAMILNRKQEPQFIGDANKIFISK